MVTGTHMRDAVQSRLRRAIQAQDVTAFSEKMSLANDNAKVQQQSRMRKDMAKGDEKTAAVLAIV